MASNLSIPTRGSSQIVPIIVGEDRAAVKLAAALGRQGFDVRAIRPPTVPPDTARLRVSVHADHAEAEIDALAAALAGALGTDAAAGIASATGAVGVATVTSEAGAADATTAGATDCAAVATAGAAVATAGPAVAATEAKP